MLLGLIEMCKWKRNKEKLKKYVVDTNYYYGPDREDEDYNALRLLTIMIIMSPMINE